MQFSRDYLIHYYEIDRSKRLTLPALLQYFEDISLLHSASVGHDLSFYERSNSGWMLLKWDVRIHDLPSFADRVSITTGVHSIRTFLADRVYAVRAGDGTLLAEARSNWLFADTVRRRPLRIPDEQYGLYGVSRESERDFVAIDELTAPPERPGADVPSGGVAAIATHEREIRTLPGDIDTNGHVNNVRYLSWALDSVPSGTFDGYAPTRLRVQYRKELGVDQSGMCRSVIHAADSGITSHHLIRSGDADCCALAIDWVRA